MNMKTEKNKINLFPFAIHLPDESISSFWISHDLAELFGYEFNSEAIDALNEKIEKDPYLKTLGVVIDGEADSVSIHCSSADEIFSISRVINELSIGEFNVQLGENDVIRLKKTLNSWIRPIRQEWGTGDIYSFMLNDGSYGFGQVLMAHEKSATCGLFKINNEQSSADIKGFRKNKVISILNVLSDKLDKGNWQIIGNKRPCDNPNKRVGKTLQGVGAMSYSSGAMELIANAWFGLVPWNCGVSIGFFDEILLRGVRRPNSAWILSKKECEDYLSTRKI